VLFVVGLELSSGLEGVSGSFFGASGSFALGTSKTSLTCFALKKEAGIM
tara:strand:- start:19133 stop:19279 length:147 start_codon:yes stop_codon:yes gene_type:complete